MSMKRGLTQAELRYSESFESCLVVFPRRIVMLSAPIIKSFRCLIKLPQTMRGLTVWKTSVGVDCAKAFMLL